MRRKASRMSQYAPKRSTLSVRCQSADVQSAKALKSIHAGVVDDAVEAFPPFHRALRTARDGGLVRDVAEAGPRVRRARGADRGLGLGEVFLGVDGRDDARALGGEAAGGGEADAAGGAGDDHDAVFETHGRRG